MSAVVNPRDIYVLSGLVTNAGERWTYAGLSARLQVPMPAVQRAIDRATAASLYDPSQKRVHIPNFEEFLSHAVRFVAPGTLGEVVPGIAAAWAAPPMRSRITTADELPPVWPSARGETQGRALEPLHKAAVAASAGDTDLRELLSVIDSLRTGDNRIRTVARELLEDVLRSPPRDPSQ